MASRRTIALLSGLAPLLVAAMRLPTAITDVSIRQRAEYVELRFGLSGAGPIWRLQPEHQRLIIELDHTRIGIASAQRFDNEATPVTGFSAVSTAQGEARIAIEVAGKIDYAVAITREALIVRCAKSGMAPTLAAPLVIPARPVGARFASKSIAHRRSAATSVALKRMPSAEVDPVIMRAPQKAASNPLVMIDPGHGGYDPGTRAADGVAEKYVALRIALALQRSLESLNIRSAMTRTDDRFLSLAERTALANHAGAELFVSIHLNSSPNPNVNGIETYYLNNTTDRATIRLARMENMTTADATVKPASLNYILTDLRQGYKANEAASLSRMIEADTVATVTSTSRVPLQPLGAKAGPFYVLVGAEMPSVLVECGFLSNPAEARLLEQPEYEHSVADGIAAAISHYFNRDQAVGNL